MRIYVLNGNQPFSIQHRHQTQLAYATCNLCFIFIDCLLFNNSVIAYVYIGSLLSHSIIALLLVVVFF